MNSNKLTPEERYFYEKYDPTYIPPRSSRGAKIASAILVTAISILFLLLS